MNQLQRFKDAQERSRDGFASALAELQAGSKTGHWIWYIFPQLSGLGSSLASATYGLADIAEATAYVRDPVLRDRLIAVAVAVAERLRAGRRLLTIMGSRIDTIKLVSSLTLFGFLADRLSAVEANDAYRRLADTAEEILAAAEAEGYPRCSFTLRRLETANRHHNGMDGR